MGKSKTRSEEGILSSFRICKRYRVTRRFFGGDFPLCSAGFCVSITEVPVARALLGVGERLRERLLGGLQLARRKRAIATFQVFGSLVLFAAVAAAGGAPAEALLAASGGACGSPSTTTTREPTRVAIWLAARLTCSKK